MLRLLGMRNVALLWWAGIISMSGTMMLMVALPITVFQLTDSSTAVAGIIMAQMLPVVTLSPILGVYVDRWDRRRTMIIANLVRVPSLLLLLFVTSAGEIWIVYVVAIINSIASESFRLTENSLLPALVEERDIVPVNSLNGLSTNVAIVAGPAIGGLATAVFGLGGVALINAVTFLSSATLLSFLTLGAATSPRLEPVVDDLSRGIAGSLRRLVTDLRSGLGIIAQSRSLTLLFIAAMINAVGNAGLNTLFAPWVATVLEGGEEEVGWLRAAQGVGGIVGSIAIASLLAGIAPLRVLGLGFVSFGLINVALFGYPVIAGGIAIGLVLQALSGGPSASITASIIGVIQIGAPDQYRGRVFGTLASLMALLALVAAPVAGVLADRVGVLPVILPMAALAIGAGLFIIVTMRPDPSAR